MSTRRVFRSRGSGGNIPSSRPPNPPKFAYSRRDVRPSPSGGSYHRPSPPHHRPHFYSWRWYQPVHIVPMVVPPIVVGGVSYEQTVYEEDGIRYAKSWTCPTSPSTISSLRVIANLLIIGIILAFILDPLFTWIIDGYIYYEDLYIISDIAFFIVPLAIILYIIAGITTSRCYNVQPL